jgi:2'-hydroxyisoflavone reductase
VKLLLLGGPKFLGRALTDAALTRGHELTFFNRGTTNADLYPDVERLVGDRKGELDALLGGRSWDAVIDTSGYFPSAVGASARALAGSGSYCFVSSISVYADLTRPVTEESELAPLGDDPTDELTPDFSNYGALKALCEDEVYEVFGERALVVRPGLIVGPFDPTGRFTYWPHRVARGGDVLAPAPAERLAQFIDVRDLAEWMLDLLETGARGTYNATNSGVPWGELLETCREVAASDARLHWVDDDFLTSHEVGEWMELPMWIAAPSLDFAVVDRALAAGLRFRPLAETVRSALDLAETTDAAGLEPAREAALLTEWNGRE